MLKNQLLSIFALRKKEIMLLTLLWWTQSNVDSHCKCVLWDFHNKLCMGQAASDWVTPAEKIFSVIVSRVKKLTMLAKSKHFKDGNLWFIPSDLMILTEETAPQCPSNICVHTPPAFQTLKREREFKNQKLAPEFIEFPIVK